jgi:hypothetical protein
VSYVYDGCMEFQYIPGGVLARKKPPPPTRRSGGENDTNWKLVSRQLRDDPGEWYHLATGSHALAQQPKIASGKTAYWRPAGSFQCCTRRREDGQIELYGVFGTPKDDLEADPEPEG